MMKTKSTLLMLFVSVMLFAQNGMNYKAIIKDNNGTVVANDLIVVQFIILQGETQTNVYQEMHTLTTDANGLVIVNDGNEIMARDNGSASELLLKHEGENVLVGGALVHISDRRLKRNIETIEYGLEEALKFSPKQYFWKHRDNQELKSLGLIAQDVKPIIENIVLERDDEMKSLSINYTELTPVLIKAIQEQQTIINTQNTTIQNQGSDISGLTTELNGLKTLNECVNI